MGTRSMTEYVRRLTRRMYRFGLRAEALGNMTDDGWSGVRSYIHAEDATDLELADAVDRLLDCEAFLADPEQVVDTDPALDAFGRIG